MACCRVESAWRKQQPYWRKSAASRGGKRIGIWRHARAITHVVPVGEASVAATFKIPRDVLTQLRAYSARSGLTLSAIVTLALQRCLIATRRRGRNG